MSGPIHSLQEPDSTHFSPVRKTATSLLPMSPAHGRHHVTPLKAKNIMLTFSPMLPIENHSNKATTSRRKHLWFTSHKLTKMNPWWIQTQKATWCQSAWVSTWLDLAELSSWRCLLQCALALYLLSALSFNSDILGFGWFGCRLVLQISSNDLKALGSCLKLWHNWSICFSQLTWRKKYVQTQPSKIFWNSTNQWGRMTRQHVYQCVASRFPVGLFRR